LPNSIGGFPASFWYNKFMVTQQKTIARLKAAITTHPDFPKPGILFYDLSPIYKDKQLFADLVALCMAGAKQYGSFDYIIGVEARGFILGAALAHELSCGFIPVRKKGKLPGELVTAEYILEYGTDYLQLQADPKLKSAKVLVMDDVFATGGTLKAVIKLVREGKAIPVVGGLMDIGIADITDLGVDYFVALD
jgi:adenine phosphoribosyltransferase